MRGEEKWDIIINRIIIIRSKNGGIMEGKVRFSKEIPTFSRK